MTEPSDDKPNGGPPLEGTAESLTANELEAVFENWQAERVRLSDADGFAELDLPLHPDELALDHEISQRPEALIAKARTAARYRLLLLVVLSLVGGLTLWVNQEDFAYFLHTENDRIELGDLRSEWKSGESQANPAFSTLEHNTWIRFENGIMTEERESRTGTFYFFEPMTKTVVVTSRSLPEKNSRARALESSFSKLVNERWIFPTDLSVGFSGEGRLLLASKAPRRYQSVIQAYVDYLRLDEDRLGDAPLWIFLDGALPEGQTVYVGIYGAALFIILLSLYFYYRARQRLRVLEESVQSTSPPTQMTP